MLSIALCDGEYITANYYYEHLTQLFQKLDEECSIDLFIDSGKLLTALYEGRRWDVYFLDIDMPLIGGLSLGKKIRQLDDHCYLVYVSIHRECVYDALEAKPFRFIPKDEFQTRVEPCIRDILEDLHKESQSNYLVLETRTCMYRYPIPDLIYAQSLDKYIVLFLTQDQQTESIRYKLSDLEQQLLPHGFIRIHKSYLVNYRFIKSIQPTCIVLDDGRKLPVSRYRLEEIKTTFRRLTL